MSLESAVKRTILYANKFGCDLTREECEERLIGSEVYQMSDFRYQFKRKNENKYYISKLELAKDLVKNHLSKFEDILMVGVTGSVASKYPKKNDDIDLMIVTKQNRLWLTRLLLKIYMVNNKIDHRKYDERHENNKFCLNMWLDEQALRLPKNKQNLRNAVDAILIIPVMNKCNVYEDFLWKNRWIKKYAATPYKKRSMKYEARSMNKTFSLVNWILFWGQYIYMKNKINKEIVGYHHAYFHPKG